MYQWEAGRSWVVTRHDDVALVLRDRRFSVSPRNWIHAEPMPMDGPTGEFYRLLGSGLAGAPPDDHVRLRKLVNPAFSPRAIERMRQRIQQIVDGMLDAAVREDTIEIRNDFAEMLPIRVLGSIPRHPGRRGRRVPRFRPGPDQGPQPLAGARRARPVRRGGARRQAPAGTPHRVAPERP